MRFSQVDIRSVWDDIKESVALTALEPAEEVYHSCRAGEAHIFTIPEGYIIVQEVRMGGTKRLHVWVAYGRANFNLLQEYLPDLEELAKSIGADEITFHTKRKGFEKALPVGWTQNYIEWTKRVNNGR